MLGTSVSVHPYCVRRGGPVRSGCSVISLAAPMADYLRSSLAGEVAGLRRRARGGCVSNRLGECVSKPLKFLEVGGGCVSPHTPTLARPLWEGPRHQQLKENLV